MPYRVGIVGCGTAGQAAGIFLVRAGHRVTILERAPTLGPVGAGILLQPTGMDVLGELGVLEQMLALGTPIRDLKGVTRRGRIVLDLAYQDLRPGLFGLGVHRGALFTVLQDAVTEAGVEVLCGCEAARWRGMAGGEVVVVDGSGREIGPFDVIVAADGARSALRSRASGVHRERQYPWGALWFVADDPGGEYGHSLSQVYDGTGSMIGFLPSGSVNGGGRTVSMFWSVRCDRADGIRGAGVEAWKADVRRLTNRAEPILAQICDVDQLIFAAYTDVVMRPWHQGRVVFLGDAGHAMSPQLGQGANLALMDAAILSRCIARSGSIRDALMRYSYWRTGNVGFYQRASRWLTPLFQSGAGWLAPPRDLLMGPLARVGWVRREMLRSLIGVKTGLFGSREVSRPIVQ